MFLARLIIGLRRVRDSRQSPSFRTTIDIVSLNARYDGQTLHHRTRADDFSVFEAGVTGHRVFTRPRSKRLSLRLQQPSMEDNSKRCRCRHQLLKRLKPNDLPGHDSTAASEKGLNVEPGDLEGANPTGGIRRATAAQRDLHPPRSSQDQAPSDEDVRRQD